MSTTNPETNTFSTSESTSKRTTEPIYTYAVSWRWLIFGLVAFFGFGGVAGGWYYLKVRDMSEKIVDVAQSMVARSDSLKERAAQANDPQEKRVLMTQSVKLRGEAANMLDTYRRNRTGETIPIVLEKLYEILESLYKDSGEGTTAKGLERGQQLKQLAIELTRSVQETDAITYRSRLLELAWDRYNIPETITYGIELFNASLAVNEDTYKARRFIAMACFASLPTRTYQPGDLRLPQSFPQAFDELLEKLNSERPGDIEIAKCYAEFVVNVGRRDRQNFTDCASPLLRDMSPEDRLTKAKNCIDTMVQHNRNDPAAHLARYHFSGHFLPPSTIGVENDDLRAVLKLDPGNAEGLILSSLEALKNSDIAHRNGEEDRKLGWQKKAEEHLLATVKANPYDPFGYQYLGDYWLFVRHNADEAVRVWNDGLEHTNHRGDEELLGRAVMVLLDQKRLDEVREKLEHLSRTIAETRVSRPKESARIGEMRTLLTAQLYNAEAEIAMSKIEAAQRENRREDVRKLFNTVQQKKADAVQLFDRILLTFGSTEEDYIMEKKSVYNLLLPMSLVQAGDLKLDLDQWDRAAAYYDCAMRFSEPPQIGRTALIKKSVAYQRGGLLDKAADVLKSAAESFPNDTQIRFMYATVLFRSQITSNNASPAMLDVVQEELENLESHRSELIQPWVIDIRLIHLGVARANLTSSAQGIIDAMSEATRKFKALEKQTFPPAADGSVRNYIDDPAFVLELVGIYSSLASRPDFDRLLVTLRKFPNGEDAYYEARINDCLRRDDKEGVVAIIDEANASTTLSASKKEKLIALLQTLKGENVDSAAALEKAYNQLKTTFDESPEMLKPQAFFDLANMSLDKNDPEQAKLVKDRLAKIEGKDGTYWRFIEVRLMLGAKDPDYIGMRKIQEDIVKFRPNWDKAYVLRAMIEERFLTENPGDSAVRQELIKFYLSATEKGNRQPEIWQRISNLYDSIGRPNDAKEIRRQAIQNNVPLDPQTGQLPQPYGRYYTEVVKAIELEDASTADEKARECITLAEKRAEKADLKYILNLTLGKVFLDALMFESAKRHLSAVAERGGKDVYPLAVCVAKSGPDHVDAGFTLILDEIDAVPSSMLQLLPALLVLQMQVKPSEEIYVRIDKLMERIERGERLTLRGKAPSEEGNTIPVGSSYVSSRKVNTMFFRFPDKSDTWDPSLIQFVSPEELSGDKSAAP